MHSCTFSCKQINVARSLAMRWRWCRLPFKKSRALHPTQTKRRATSLLGWENLGCKLWTHCKYIDKHRMSCSSPSCESIFRFYTSCNFLTDRHKFMKVRESSSSLRSSEQMSVHLRPAGQDATSCVLRNRNTMKRVWWKIRNRNKGTYRHMLSLGVQRSGRPKQLRFVVKSWRYCILMTLHKDSLFLLLNCQAILTSSDK